MSMETVRFGMVGCGMIARFHARALAQVEEAELTACFDPNGGSARAFAAEHGAAVFPTLEALLDSDIVDAVCVCTPSGLHTPQAVQALRAGRHVVVEKPMSLTLDEADLLIQTAGETGKKVCVISQFRFQPGIQAVKGALDAGAFGRVTSARLSMPYYRSEAYYRSGGWRGTWKMDGGGALMNQGIHGVDVFRYLLGPVRCVRGAARTLVHEIEVEDTAAAVLEFQNGALAVLEGTTACTPGYPRMIEIRGTEGSVVLEEDSILRWDLPVPCPLPVGAPARNAAVSDPAAISVEGHLRQLQNFVRAVLYGEDILVDAAAGRPALEVILGIYESSRTDRPVFLAGGEEEKP